MVLNILLLAIGIALLIVGGNWFVSSAIDFGKKTKIPSIIVGATIVSIATTLPELFVSTISAARGSFGLSIGNAAGSVICNTALIAGLSMAFMPTIIKEKDSPIKYWILIASTLLLFAFSMTFRDSRVIAWYEAVIFLAIFALFMTVNIVEAKNTTQQLKLESLSKKKKNIPTEDLSKIKWWKIILFFILGAAGVAGGAILTVNNAEAIAKSLGISDTFIGLTIAAIGTSLPELVSTIISIKKKNSEIGYGNIIGANILNITLIIGLSGVISGKTGLAVSTLTFAVSLPFIIVITGIFLLPIILKQKTYRWQGITLLSLYGVYMTYLIVATLKGLAV